MEVKKLWIILDEEIKDQKLLSKTDIIYTNNISLKNKNLVNKIYIHNINYCNENKSISTSTNNLLNELGNEYKILANAMYVTIFLKIVTYIVEIEKILLKNDIKKIILVGGNKDFYFSISDAEGEGEKWFYKSSWMINSILNNYYKDKIDILWLKKENILISKLKHTLRDNFLYYKVILYEIIKRLLFHIKKEKKYRRNIEIDLKNKNVLSIVGLELQYIHLKELFKSLKGKINFICFSFSKQIVKKNKNCLFLEPLEIRELFSLLKISLKFNKNKKKIYYFKWKNLKIKLEEKKIKKAIKVEYLYNLIRIKKMYKALKLIQNQNIKPNFLVTNMTIGSDIGICHKFARNKGIKHINFQYVTMGKIMYPNLNLADEYYLYSKSTYEIYKKYSSIYKYYFPLNDKNIYLETVNEVITIFLQPDHYAERYLEFLEKLAFYIEKEKYNLKFKIKFHYRQNKVKELNELIAKYKFYDLVDKDISARKCILESKCIISMTSSVLSESMFLHIPGIIIDIDGKDREYLNKNDVCGKEVNFRVNSYEQLFNILKYFDKYQEIYNMRLKNFLQNMGIENNENFLKYVFSI